MVDERDAEDAIRALDNTEFGRQRRRLCVEWAKVSKLVALESIASCWAACFSNWVWKVTSGLCFLGAIAKDRKASVVFVLGVPTSISKAFNSCTYGLSKAQIAAVLVSFNSKLIDILRLESPGLAQHLDKDFSILSKLTVRSAPCLINRASFNRRVPLLSCPRNAWFIYVCVTSLIWL